MPSSGRRTSMIERAGFWRRCVAAVTDLIVAQVLFQGLVALLFAASAGHVMGGMAFYTACRTVATAPTGVTLPPGFVATSQSLCTASVFGVPTRSFYVAGHDDKAGTVTTTTTFSAAASPDGSVGIRALDLDALFYPLFILLRWASDRFAGGSLGRRLVRIAVTDAGGTARGAELPPLLARRYARFAWSYVPGTLVLALGAAFEATSGTVPPLLAGLTWMAGSALVGVTQLAAAMAIFRHQDTFYDAPAGTAVAPRLEIARAADLRPEERVAAGPGPIRDLRGALGAARRSVPWFSLGLLGVMAAVFLGETLMPWAPAGQSGVAIDTLVAWGGMDRELVVLSQQPYRLLSSIFLHASLTHLVVNGVALVTAGVLLERRLGPVLFGGVFLLGGLAGSVASVMINPPQLISVGASGGIMALFAAALAISLRVPAGNARRWLQAWPIVVCIPMVLPMAALPGAFVVDRADHAGGEVGGLLLGIAIAAAWRHGTVRHPSRRTGLGATAALAVLAGITVLIGGGLRAPLHAARLVPPAELPRSDEAWMRQGPALAARYPEDPRALLGLATGEARDGARARAIADLDRAIAAQRRLAPASAGDFRFTAHSVLAGVFFDGGDLDAAIAQYGATLGERPLATVFRQRGIAEFYSQRTAEAVSDLRQALTLDPKEDYSVLWLSIVAARSGMPDPIAATSAEADLDKWPGQIIKFYDDALREDVMSATAGALDLVSDEHRVCEEKFYRAEWHLGRREVQAAHTLLQDAVATCPQSFIEHRAALEELAGHGGLPAE